MKKICPTFFLFESIAQKNNSFFLLSHSIYLFLETKRFCLGFFLTAVFFYVVHVSEQAQSILNS